MRMRCPKARTEIEAAAISNRNSVPIHRDAVFICIQTLILIAGRCTSLLFFFWGVRP